MGVQYEKDHYFHKAKRDGYRARSAYKLEEIQKKFHVLSPGGVVLDFGAAPGSWTQYAARVVGKGGKVSSDHRLVWVDLAIR